MLMSSCYVNGLVQDANMAGVRPRKWMNGKIACLGGMCMHDQGDCDSSIGSSFSFFKITNHVRICTHNIISLSKSLGGSSSFRGGASCVMNQAG